MHFFDLQARRIIKGDWLLERPMHPLHYWHEQSAKAYFETYPEARSTYLDKSPEKSPEEALWDDWYGGSRYHQEPFYPYLIATVYGIFGTDVRHVFLLQMALGVLTVLLLYSISGHLFNKSTALVAALLAALYGPLLFYEMVLLRASVICFWGMLFVWIYLRARRHNSKGWYAALGLVAGISLLIKSNFLILAGGLFVLVTWQNRKCMRQFLRPFLAGAGGFLLALTPLVVRNVAVEAPLFSSGSVTAIVLLGGNGPNADQWVHVIRSNEVADIFSKSEGKPLATMIETLKAHSFSSYVQLVGAKVMALFHAYEAPNNISYDQFRLYPTMLRLLPMGSGFILALAACGFLMLYQKRDESALPLVILAVAHIIPILLAVVVSRFKMPLIVAIIPVAAYALTSLWSLWKSGEYRKAGLYSLLAVTLALFMSRPLPGSRQRVPVQYWLALYQTGYQPMIERNLTEGNPHKVLHYVEELHGIHNKYQERWLGRAPLETISDIQTARHFNQVNLIYALTLREAGQEEEAQAALIEYHSIQKALEGRNEGSTH
jgi:4-amino-4-deoxy-L-arabinose transferase-like glycosyltransferase